jgi:hypothetical protein
MHALDGLTNYLPPPKERSTLYSKPMIYTLAKDSSGRLPEAAYMATVPAGIAHTPVGIHDFKRTVFDFRGTPLVSIVENHPEVRAPPQQINDSRKNIS